MQQKKENNQKKNRYAKYEELNSIVKNIQFQSINFHPIPKIYKKKFTLGLYISTLFSFTILIRINLKQFHTYVYKKIVPNIFYK